MVDVREAHAFAFETFQQHNLTDWKIRWNRHRRRAGLCQHNERTVTLSAVAVQRWTWPEVEGLVIHELAHALLGPGAGHDRLWKAKVRSLGGKNTEENCPHFGGWLSDATSSANQMNALLLVGGSAFVSIPIALVIAAAVATVGTVAVLDSRRTVLTEDEIAEIERLVLNP
jgi:hypothetical protein